MSDATAAGTAFVEHARVQVTHDLEGEGYALCKGMTGTVVAIYGRGEAYAVEFDGLQGEMDVVTVYAHDIEEAMAAGPELS